MCKNEDLIQLAESVGLTWTGDIDENGQPEFIGNLDQFDAYESLRWGVEE